MQNTFPFQSTRYWYRSRSVSWISLLFIHSDSRMFLYLARIYTWSIVCDPNQMIFHIPTRYSLSHHHCLYSLARMRWSSHPAFQSTPIDLPVQVLVNENDKEKSFESYASSEQLKRFAQEAEVNGDYNAAANYYQVSTVQSISYWYTYRTARHDSSSERWSFWVLKWYAPFIHQNFSFDTTLKASIDHSKVYKSCSTTLRTLVEMSVKSWSTWTDLYKLLDIQKEQPDLNLERVNFQKAILERDLELHRKPVPVVSSPSTNKISSFYKSEPRAL